MLIKIWAASWQNQQNGMCAQRRLRSVVWSETFYYILSALQRPWSDWADAGLIWVFTGRIYLFFCFVMRRLIIFFLMLKWHIDVHVSAYIFYAHNMSFIYKTAFYLLIFLLLGAGLYYLSFYVDVTSTSKEIKLHSNRRLPCASC